MASERSAAQAEPQRKPHSITLKVLRLLRPLLHQQYPLPLAETCSDDTPDSFLQQHSFAYPSSTDNQFILSPLLTLPPAFGNAYIGENFSCCLSAINETESEVSNIRITAEIQTPSISQPLELFTVDDQLETSLAPKASMQRIAKYDLREEGVHVLVVTVTYSEPRNQETLTDYEKAQWRIRIFRKLYQFVALHRMTVKTKGGELPDGKAILEAQLENNGDGPISLERVYLTPRKGWKTTSLNWDQDGEGAKVTPLLQTRDVMQVAFLLHLDPSVKKDDDVSSERIVLGQLSIEWRSSCGDRGFLSTGYLTAKRHRQS